MCVVLWASASKLDAEIVYSVFSFLHEKDVYQKVDALVG